MTNWHVNINGEAKGPFEDEQVRALCEAGTINAGTLVWNPDLTDWTPIGQTDFVHKASLGPPPSPGSGMLGAVPATGGATPSSGMAQPSGFAATSPTAAAAPVTAYASDYGSTGQAAPVSGAQVDGAQVVPDERSMWEFFTRALTERYAQFTGRARRKEYWSFTLFYVIFLLAAGFVGGVFDGLTGNVGPRNPNGSPIIAFVLVGLFYVATFIPGLALTIRRLHDLNFTGWLVLVGLIPYIGGIVLLIFMLLPTKAGANDHGPAPKHVT
ncbi:MAG: DUF805 domain-containing protein [Pseudomonadota bacterium]